MKPWHRHFTATFFFCVAAATAAFAIGGWPAVATIVFLTVLETSLSFDNAVVNAAVSGRLGRDLAATVSHVGHGDCGLRHALGIPFVDRCDRRERRPDQGDRSRFECPHRICVDLTAAHHQIAAFGGTFLMMVFLHFFFASHKTEHWLSVIERPLTRLGKLEAIEAALTLLVVLSASRLIDNDVRAGQFVVAGVWGVVVFILTKG